MDGRGINGTVNSVDSVDRKTIDNFSSSVDPAVYQGGCTETVSSVDTMNRDTIDYSRNSADWAVLGQENNEEVNSVDLVNRRTTGHSGNPDDRALSETVVVIISDEEDAVCISGENRDSNEKVNVVGLNKAVDQLNAKDLKDEKHSCVIDVKCDGKRFGENLDGEWVCRICHLSSGQSSESSTAGPATHAIDLMELGCRCKGQLGIAHSYCAEAWFKLKGNRFCEICGETAKNVTGLGDNRLEWNDRRSTASRTNLSASNGACWRGQPFCNFLMVCLVIAFVLPWFFRVNMF